jgi:hypothetical protein
MSLPIDFFAMTNPDDSHCLTMIIDLIHYAIISDANTPAVSVFQFLAPWWTRIFL